MSKSYKPQPVILSLREFPGDIIEHIDILARNVHEQWASGRIEEGWRYGEYRNDELKEHPTLVPYEELPESEKEYDRQTVIATLSALIFSGFEIRKKISE